MLKETLREVELMATKFTRINNVCFDQCVEKDLTKGEGVCIDRCVMKYFLVYSAVAKRLEINNK